MLRKLGSYPRQNGLAGGPCASWAGSSTLFIPDWLQSVELLRRRVHAGLNKGEARNSLAGRCSSTALGNQGSWSFRAAALVGPAASTPGDGGYRAVEHGVRGTRHRVGRGRQAGGRRAAAIPVAAGLGSTST